MQIAPSILSADFANLEAELQRIGNADWAHVDVMDAHFVPNLTLGLPIVEALLKVSPIPLDCHLMIEDPDRWAPQYAEAGAQSVTFHIEAANDPVKLARFTPFINDPQATDETIVQVPERGQVRPATAGERVMISVPTIGIGA